jgi:ABC-type lipoprotein release transport system permease subunit
MSRSGGRYGVWLWARAELRRRWMALLVLGLLAGVTAGVATAAVAGARRTDTAWDRLRDQTQASDAVVFASQAGIYSDDELHYDRLAALPYVEGAGAFGVWYATSSVGQAGGFLSNGGDWLDGVDRPRIVEGRAPDPHDPLEVAISPSVPGGELAESGLGVGDTLDIHLFTQQQMLGGDMARPRGPAVTLEIVGITDGPFNLAAIPSTGDIYVGPAFTDRYGPGLAAFSNLVVRLDDPERDVPRLEAEVARLYPGRGVPVYDLATAGKRVTNGTGLERSGLLLFAAAVAVAGLAIVGQALTRSVQSGSGDVPTLVSLGFSRRQAAWALAVPHLVSGAVAVAVTVVTAVALSPRFPIGLGRRVDPDVGLHVDLPVLVAGAGLVALALGGGVVFAAWRAAAPAHERQWGPRRSTIVSALLRLGAPIPLSIGAGLALEPGRGQRALPTRPALVGACAGALGVMGAMTLAAGIGDATSHAERFGSVWDAEVSWNDAPDAPFRATVDGLAHDPEVTDVTRVARVTLPVGDVVLPFYGLQDVTGSIRFVALEGRAPERPGEVLLGPDSASTFGVGVGDQIEIGSGGRFTVVGLGLLPTTPHSSFDQGGWMLPEDLVTATPDSVRAALVADRGGAAPDDPADVPDDAELGQMLSETSTAVARFAHGVDVHAKIAHLSDEAGDTVMITPAAEPADQQNLRNVRGLPLLFAVFLLALAVGALAHVTTSVLRRRRGELAILRALGLTPRQVRACLAWQATTLAVVGVVVGVPLGIALGRSLWRLVADATPMVYAEPVAVVALAAIVPVALVLANVLAAVPGHRAARLRPAEVLRTE